MLTERGIAAVVFAEALAQELNEHLAAGGVVQVTTPTKSWLYRQAHAGSFFAQHGNLHVRNGRSELQLSAGKLMLVSIRKGRLKEKAGSRVAHSYPKETARQLLSYEEVGGGRRLFLTAIKKDSEKNFLDPEGEVKTVEATFDLDGEPGVVYLNRIDALRARHGYGIEVMRVMKDAFRRNGFNKIIAYVTFESLDSASMMQKLGGKTNRETSGGRYWEIDL